MLPTRKTRKRGGNGNGDEAFKGKTVVRVTDSKGKDFLISKDMQRVSNVRLTFTTSDGHTYTVSFKAAEENEGQFNLGVGTVEEDPTLFARIQKVDETDKEEITIYSGFLLHRMAPKWFVNYKGVYHIGPSGSPLYLEVMEKVDTTLFHYIVGYVKDYLIQNNKNKDSVSLNTDDIKTLLAHLCPMVYRLYFQKMVIEEIKYRTFGERYIDFKSDNIGLMLDADGIPKMKLFDQYVGEASFVAKGQAIIYEWSNELAKSGYIPEKLQLNIRTDVKDVQDKNLYRSVLQASDCANEKSLLEVKRSLLMSDTHLRYIYNVCVHISIIDNLLVFPDKWRYTNNDVVNGINMEKYYKDILKNDEDLMELQRKTVNEKNEQNKEYSVLDVNKIKNRAKILISDNVTYNVTDKNSFKLLQLLITSLDDNRMQQLKRCVYLSDSDFEAFVGKLNSEYNEYLTLDHKSKNSYYEPYDWFLPEYIRFAIEQIVGLMRIWRTLVRTHFVLGPMEKDGKIWLMEAKEEAFRFPALFKHLCRQAGVDGMDDILSELKERVLPTEVQVLSLDDFIKTITMV